MVVIILTVSFFASTIGAICGIGGGVIIKPVLDALGLFDAGTVNFLSGCTVLAMSGYSVAAGLIKGHTEIDLNRGTFLAVGAALGGITGKYLFEYIKSIFTAVGVVSAIQACVLFLITGATMAYTKKKEKIKTKEFRSKPMCVSIGLCLGLMSSFLGIGGGPINLAVLSYLFSMSSKIAAQNSLYIILISQISSLFITIGTNTIPSFSPPILLGMMTLGIIGGIYGRKVNNYIDDKKLDKLFFIILFIIMLICLYNFLKNI